MLWRGEWIIKAVGKNITWKKAKGEAISSFLWNLGWTPGLRRQLVVSVKNPTLILIPHWEKWSRPCRGRLRPSRCEFCAGVLCTELAPRGSESGTTGSGSSRRLQVFQVIQGSSVVRHIHTCYILFNNSGSWSYGRPAQLRRVHCGRTRPPLRGARRGKYSGIDWLIDGIK